jgi:hypothetical protein
MSTFLSLILALSASPDAQQLRCAKLFTGQHHTSFNELPAVHRKVLMEKLPGDGPIQILSFDNLDLMKPFRHVRRDENVWYWDQQLIRRADDLEKEVLNLSDLGSAPHEVLTFRAYVENKPIHFPDFHHGTNDEVPVELVHEALTVFAKKFEQIYPGRQLIERLELIHSHPDFEAVGNGDYLAWPLSPRDVNNGRWLSHMLPGTLVVVKAVVANGYTREAYFFKGFDVSYQFHH